MWDWLIEQFISMHIGFVVAIVSASVCYGISCFAMQFIEWIEEDQ